VLTGGASYSAITVTVNVANNAPATVTNSATVSGGGDTNASNSTASDPTSIVQLPDLTLSLVHGGTFTQGQTGATYVLSVTDVGASPTSGVVTVTDTLPSGLTLTGLAGNGWSCVLASLTCTRSDQLAAGASYPSITLTADIAMTAPASVTNTAVVSGGGDSASTNNSASDVTTIVQLADLTVSVAHSGAFSRGQSGATYAITVNNSGAAPTAGTVTVSDALPAGLTATGMNGAGWTCTLATLTCLRGDALGPGLGYPTITLTVDVASNVASAVVNTATVAGGGEVNLANDAASDPTTIVSPPDLIVAKTHTGSFTQGQTGATYTITVTNAGSGSTTAAVAVSDLLPAGLTATALSGTGWTCSLATVVCTRGDALAPAASFPNIVLTVNVSSTAPASVMNTATVSGGGELNTANDTATDPTTIAVGAAPPVFVAETHFAVDQNTSGPNRANLSLHISGTNNLLLLAFHMEFDGGDTNWSVQDNGIPGTLLVNTDGYTGGAGNQRFRIYYWVNPPTGNNSIVVQNSSTGDNEITVAATLFGNVAQTNPIGAVTLDVSTTPRTSESETVAATPSDLVVHVIADAVCIRRKRRAAETEWR
jgi:uncharacterized repeat protein (TIGR01451 family)